MAIAATTDTAVAAVAGMAVLALIIMAAITPQAAFGITGTMSVVAIKA